MTGKSLIALIDGERAGEVHQSRFGVDLVYDNDYARQDKTPLSTAFSPDHNASFPPRKVRVWLEGLLPDNREVRRAWRQQFDISGSTAFDILNSPIGHDCAGSVQFCSEEEVDGLLSRKGHVEWLSDDDLGQVVQSLRDPRTTWHEPGDATGGRFSLAGAQAKIALVRTGDRFGIPRGSEPSTVIIKPTINDPSLPDQAVNEHLCLATAFNLGISAAHTEIAGIGNIQCVVGERYDRIFDASGKTLRVHQEDLCQALGIHPDNKYQSSGGPTPEDIVALLRTHSSDRDHDVERFVDALIYNWLIVGTDAHAKNYSLLLGNGAVRLAPLYDVSSYLPYPSNWTEVNKAKLAMRIGNRYALRNNDSLSAWRGLAASLGLDETATIDRAEQMAQKLPNAFHEAVSALPPEFKGTPTISLFESRIERRSRKCAGLSKMTGKQRQ